MKSVPEGRPWRGQISVMFADPNSQRAMNASSIRGVGLVASPEEITNRIQVITDQLAEESGFSMDTIVVRVESPGAPDLTLIDLPGIVRTHTSGQDPGVVQRVNRMIEWYLSQERTVILAVVPSNQDVATIDILERATRVDPKGVRTLGVLTKPDLINPGSEPEVLAVLTNERKPLKLGYIMVKCRSQKDLDSDVSLAEAKEQEMAFFREHPDWRMCKTDILGTQNLTKRLTTLLVERIQIALPALKWELQNLNEQAEEEIKPLGNARPRTLKEQQRLLMHVVSDFCSLMRQSARGFYGNPLLAQSSDVRLFQLCQEAFARLKDSVVQCRPAFGDPHFREQMAVDMQALQGRELPGFHNSQAFYHFIAQNIEAWRPAVDRCKNEVVDATRAVLRQLIVQIAPSYPELCNRVYQLAASVVNDVSETMSECLDDIFVKESDPFTANENMFELINQMRFRNFDKAVQQVMASITKGDSAEELQALVIQRLGAWYMQFHGVNVSSRVGDMIIMIEAYWDVATKRLVDNVCMTFEHDFLWKILKRVESECFLMGTLVGQNVKELDGLFSEDPAMEARRRDLFAKRERLSTALATLRKMAPNIIAQRPDADGGEKKAGADNAAATTAAPATTAGADINGPAEGVCDA